MAWTPEQLMAIETSGCSLLVAAAAGAGKTSVLVERIIKKITDDKKPVDIDRLLVVTFTNAAASEMRERIGDAISKELEENPDSIRLQRQIALLNKSDITTIHSFCLEVIRNNFHMIDLDPSFRIADSTECVLLKQEVVEELFDDMYEDDRLTDEFLDLVECYGGGRDDSGLKDIVLRLYEFSQSTPWPEEWLKNMAEMYNVDDTFDFGSTKWASILADNARIELSGICSGYSKLVEILKDVDELQPYYAHIKNEMEGLNNVLQNCTAWDTLVSGLSGFEFKKIPTIRKAIDVETKDYAKKTRDALKKQVNGIMDGILSTDLNRIKEDMGKLYPAMKALAQLTVEFGERYRLRKKEKGIIDFNDIEHFCISILAQKGDNGEILPTDVALKYRERFEEVLVDEYQDSNMVQELILSMVSRKDTDNPNMFMVGDVKQSIYRFRQAKPELFLEKYNTYKDTGKERLILLYKNFRSREEVLDAANYIMKGIMSKNIGELEYDDDEKLNPGAEYGLPDDEGAIFGGAVEIHIAESTDVEGDASDEEGSENININSNRDIAAEEDAPEDIDKVQLEARMVASRINELTASGFMVYDKNKKSYREMEYRDIVILMRSVSSSAPVFMEELSNRGIPVYADTGSGYFDVVEVQTVLSLLQIIDNPMQDIPLLAVLRSPIASFTSEELIDIRMADGKKTFFEALKAKAGAGEEDTSKKACGFLKELDKWRSKSLNMSISEFIWYLYTDTGYYAYAGAMPGGVQRQANLRILFERARQYEETSFKGLFNFINFINKLKESSGDMGSAKILGENENVVRIMSIHKSKGLEFPVVFVSGLGKKFNKKDLNRKILFHHELGLGPDFVDSKRRIYYPTIIKQAIAKKMKFEGYSEEMRILYVALTRAKEKLILTGTVANMEKALNKWSESIDCPGNKVPEHQILKGNCFLDWICPALLKHEKLKDFREAAKVELSPSSMVDDASKWDVKLYAKKDILKGSINIADDAAAAVEMPGKGKYWEEVSRRLDYKYPYSMSSTLPAKLTVTELKRMAAEDYEDEYTGHIFVPRLVKKPLFLEGTVKMSAAEKGTIMHMVMQHVDLGRIGEPQYVESLLTELTDSEFMTEAQKESVDIERILSFFNTDLGRRMVNSCRVCREVPFYMEISGIDVQKSLPDIYKNEQILLQGVIDCYFEENDGIVLIDYKTDRVPDGNTDIIRDRYRVQLDYYTRALEKMTGKKVKEKYIYLFYNGEILEF